MDTPDAGDNGFRPGRTLRAGVEFSRQLRRRRTHVVALVLLVLPLAIALAFEIGSPESSVSSANGDFSGPLLANLATKGALNFALFTEFASAGFLLVVLVALFCGDTVASEASWSSLRYLLAAPVPRSRLLVSKLLVALWMSAAAMVLLPLVALAVGTVAYGWGPLQLPTGGSLSTGAA